MNAQELYSSLAHSIVGGVAFMVSLISIMLLFAWGQPRRDRFWVRLAVSVAVMLGICVLTDNLMFFFVPQEISMWPYIVKFTLVLVMSCATVAISFKVKIWEILYFGVIGYCVQHLCARTFDVFQDLCLENVFWVWRSLIDWIYYAVVYVLLWRFYIRKNFRESTLVIHGKAQLILAVCVVGVSIIYNTLGIAYASGAIYLLQSNGLDASFGYNMLIFVYITTALIAMLAFALSVTSNSKAYYSEEKHMLDKLLSDRRARYEQDKMSIELLNMRLHDLKHYIGSLDERSFKEQKDGIVDYISQYDSGYNCGNDALDTLFTNKSVQCKSKGIRFNAMLGGAEFGGLPKFELYAIFCNAIDNAIEAVENLPEEKRFISISAQRGDGNKTIVTVENYFDGNIRMKNNMPQSDKKGDLHGVGVKSMKMLMEKYGGGMEIDVYDEIFSLKLIF